MSLSCSGEDQIPRKSYCGNAVRWNTSQMRKVNFGVSAVILLTEHIRCCSQEEKPVYLHTAMGTWFPARQREVVSVEALTCQLSKMTWVASLRRWLPPADSLLDPAVAQCVIQEWAAGHWSHKLHGSTIWEEGVLSPSAIAELASTRGLGALSAGPPHTLVMPMFKFLLYHISTFLLRHISMSFILKDVGEKNQWGKDGKILKNGKW